MLQWDVPVGRYRGYPGRMLRGEGQAGVVLQQSVL